MRANSFKDVNALALALANVAEADRWKIVATLHYLGLMRFHGPGMRFSLWLIRKTRGKRGVFNFFYQLGLRSPQTIEDFLVQSVTHILGGQDTEDDDSVGGLSQRELDLLLDEIGPKQVKEN